MLYIFVLCEVAYMILLESVCRHTVLYLSYSFLEKYNLAVILTL